MPRHVVIVAGLAALAVLLNPEAMAQGGDAFQKKREAVLREMEPIWKRTSDLANSGRLKEADASARHAIARATALTGPGRPAVARGHGLLGYVYFLRGQYPAAEQEARRCLSMCESTLGPNDPGCGRAARLLGMVLGNQSRYRDAETYLNRALSVLERNPGPDHPDTAWTLFNLARVRDQQGRIGESEALGRRALAVFEKAKEGMGIARTLHWLGIFAWHEGRYADSEALLKRALAAGEAAFGSQHWEVAMTLTQLGVVYSFTGRFAEADSLLRRSVAALEGSVGPEHLGTIEAMRALGKMLVNSGQAHEGELVLRKAVGMAEKSLGPDHVHTGHLLRELANALHQEGQFAEAETIYKRNLALVERLPGGHWVGFSLFGMGNLYLAQQRLAEAKPLLESALLRAETSMGREHPATLSSLHRLAEVDLQLKQPADALTKLKRAAAVLETHRTDEGVLAGQRFNRERGPMLRRAVASTLATAAWELSAVPGATVGDLSDDGFAAAQLATQSTAASAISQMAARFATGDDALGQLVRKGQDHLQRWHTIDKQLTAEAGDVGSDPSARTEQRAELEGISKQLAEVDYRLAAEFPQYAALTQANALKIAEVQQIVRADEAVLVFLTGNKQSFVWAITRDAANWQRTALDAAGLAERTVRLRKGLDVAELQKGAATGNPQLFDLQLAHELYRELLGPVAQMLEGKPNLYIVASGPLTSLPFHLLVTEPPASPIKDLKQIADYSNAAWIIKRHAVTVIPSVASLKALRALTKRPPAAKPLVGYGDPAFGTVEGGGPTKPGSGRPTRAYTAYWKGGLVDVESLARGLEPLPETAIELRGVAKALGALGEDIHLGRAATETVVKKTDLAQYRIVYFATHGLVAGEVSGLGEPALVLTPPAIVSELDDGLLTASEVAQLKLNAEWVVLSACNTAAGDRAGAEAFSGLARAFFYAGARTLLVSHWSVDSAAAVRLTTKAFEVLRADPKLGRAEAMRQSMLAYMQDRSDPLNAYPAFWGPFAIVGEGG